LGTGADLKIKVSHVDVGAASSNGQQEEVKEPVTINNNNLGFGALAA
jgi:hypothetical protein